MRKVAHMERTVFTVADYRDVKPTGAVIYADPPYAGTTGYANGVFDSAEFYEWCEARALDNAVYVSEFTVPDRYGWKVVLDMPRTLSVRRKDGAPVHDYLIRVRA
jgi:hypothetical protein